MAAAHWCDPVAPRFSAGDTAVTVVVVPTECATAAGRGGRALARRAALGLTATSFADNPVAVTIAHISVGRMVAAHRGDPMGASLGARDTAIIVVVPLGEYLTRTGGRRG